MALDDLDRLKKHLPEVFENRTLPPDWEEKWIFIPAPEPEAMEKELPTDLPIETIAPAEIPLPELPILGIFPGAPQTPQPPIYPPPDSLAFYLPFHYYHPIWWGIYLTYEGTGWLAHELNKLCNKLELNDAFYVARVFLYRHEAFHHGVEAFATRLEVTHRQILYRGGFETVYRDTFGTDNCLEEALATAYAFRKVRDLPFVKKKNIRHRIDEAFTKYIMGCPPGYRRGIDFLRESAFCKARAAFAENNQSHSLPQIPTLSPEVWDSFSNAYKGIAQVKSRVNYIVHIGSPLATRVIHCIRDFTHRDLVQKLQKLARCKVVRQGANHEIWENPRGLRFPVPRHPRDLAIGTLHKIIREAGLNMSVEEFVTKPV